MTFNPRTGRVDPDPHPGYDWSTPPVLRLAPHAVTLEQTLAAMDDQQATHARLIAAGWEWDGMDGYTAPDVVAWMDEFPTSDPAEVLRAQQAFQFRRAETGRRWPDQEAKIADLVKAYTARFVETGSKEAADQLLAIWRKQKPDIVAEWRDVGAYTPEDADPFMTPAALRRALVVGAVVAVACAAVAGWQVVLA